jgi:NAD(P)-dependent dehydrogenase (short-subunit alcohol dehydrogenase family)
VTGGSRGIGKAIARQLAREGADVAIAARSRPRLEAAVAELQTDTGRRVLPIEVDIADAAAITRMTVEAEARLGKIDILVNCAARPLDEAPPIGPGCLSVTGDYFLDEMNSKVLGYLRCAQAVAPGMKERGWGRIINIGGLAARHTPWAVGSMRNVAVVALTKNLADELGRFGINVTVVHPGTTITEAMSDEARMRSASNLLGRFVDASEVADVVTFLASPRSVAVNGDTIAAGGGEPRVIYY